jgi:hypothetical protein
MVKAIEKGTKMIVDGGLVHDMGFSCMGGGAIAFGCLGIGVAVLFQINSGKVGSKSMATMDSPLISCISYVRLLVVAQGKRRQER